MMLYRTYSLADQTYSKRGPQVIAEDKFGFEVFVLLIEEWLRRKLRVRTAVKCLR
jgi:putative transposase